MHYQKKIYFQGLLRGTPRIYPHTIDYVGKYMNPVTESGKIKHFVSTCITAELGELAQHIPGKVHSH